MAVVVCASATGAPGVTTTALGLALAWPRDVLLADCDRDPAQVVQAGYLRGANLAGRGLLALSRAHREGRPLAQEVWMQAVPLSASDEPARRFLPGFTHPGSAALFQPVWSELGQAFVELADSGADVIVDGGRVGRDGLPAGLLSAADVVLLIVRSSLRSLVALRLHLPGVINQLATASDRASVGLAIVGEGRPYSAAEIGQQFGCPAWFSVAFDPQAAAVLSDGEPTPRRFGEAPLLRSLKVAASAVSERLNEQAAERDGLKWAVKR